MGQHDMELSMKKKTIVGLIAGFVFGLAGAIGAAVLVPHQFVAGQPAKAAEVNANFDALANAIGDLQKATELVVQDANGQVVGRLLSFDVQSQTTQRGPAIFKTSTGKIIRFHATAQSIIDPVLLDRRVYFASTDCSGQGYVPEAGAFMTGILLDVSGGEDSSIIWHYADASAAVPDLTLKSLRPNVGSSSCTGADFVGSRLAPVIAFNAAENLKLNSFVAPFKLVEVSAGPIPTLN